MSLLVRRRRRKTRADLGDTSHTRWARTPVAATRTCPPISRHHHRALVGRRYHSVFSAGLGSSTVRSVPIRRCAMDGVAPPSMAVVAPIVRAPSNLSVEPNDEEASGCSLRRLPRGCERDVEWIFGILRLEASSEWGFPLPKQQRFQDSCFPPRNWT